MKKRHRKRTEAWLLEFKNEAVEKWTTSINATPLDSKEEADAAMRVVAAGRPRNKYRVAKYVRVSPK